MALSRDFKTTIAERAQRDPQFAQMLFSEALDLLQNGEAEAARAALRTLVNATIGFEDLARQTHGDPKSLHRMLSPKGNPGMNNLSVLLKTIRQSVEPKPRRRTGTRAPAPV